MAKRKSGAQVARPDRLEEPMKLFLQGDYVRARSAFEAVSRDPQATDAEKETASSLVRSTRIDPMTAFTGVACLVLFAVAVTFTALIQPH